VTDKPSGQAASAILLSVSQSVVVFTALLPPLAEVRKGSKADPNIRDDVRVGELAATTLVIGIGIIASGVAGTPAPVMASIVCALALVALYETVLSK
jgi:hypothetical protein